MTSWRLRALLTTVATAAVVLSIAPPAVAAPALEIKSIAFDRASVDVSQGGATVDLTWTITNRAARAARISGVVEMRQYSGDVQIGQPRAITYDLRPGSDVYGSGTPQESTYAYRFEVPRYAAEPATVWRVTKLTVADDLAHARTVKDPGPATLTVTQAVDTNGPVLQQIFLDYNQKRAVYDDGSGVTLRYRMHINDETAFKRGKLTLAGPGGTRLSTTFQLTKSGTQTLCGDEAIWSTAFPTCTAAVVVPGGSASGAWQVARVDLTDMYGNTRTETSFGLAPIVVSRNDKVSASGFALTEAQVNNWRQNATTELVLTPHGAVEGLATVDVIVPSCTQVSRTPVVREDGSVAVSIVMPAGYNGSCHIEGVKLTDGAGNVALYGTDYGAPNLNLFIRPVPDNKPPVVLSARLPKSTWTQQETQDGSRIGFDVTVELDEFAEVSGYYATLYDIAGETVGGASGGLHDYEGNGVYHLGVYPTRRLEAGEYTIGFSLSDDAEMSSQWGDRNGGERPIPGGPLVVTVVAD
ncbi:hypothetical protein KOI35_08970 [Actinoplanes bogorensis]|uniref:Uncharacterized protein n=1 Tax=Paractinoplanes bogorensis TaxID=1610840 RepID=A0ABS5YKS1_9ACTN|nr:hypothetical protein [Actinoplanes bogorensis]MBU2663636.1 hypothetical protein [Actinoplanes bogorensis]